MHTVSWEQDGSREWRTSAERVNRQFGEMLIVAERQNVERLEQVGVSGVFTLDAVYGCGADTFSSRVSPSVHANGSVIPLSHTHRGAIWIVFAQLYRADISSLMKLFELFSARSTCS